MKPKMMAKALWEKRCDGNVRTPRPLREVAAEAGISSATFSRIERGGTPDLQTYILLCRWLNVELETFIGDFD